MLCSRCNKTTQVFFCSVFDHTEICQSCFEKEETHPLYGEALRAEQIEFKKKNYFFTGIGKPDDL